MPGSPPTLQNGIRTAALRRVVDGGVGGSGCFNKFRRVLRVLGVIGVVNDISDDDCATASARRKDIDTATSKFESVQVPCVDITSKSY